MEIGEKIKQLRIAMNLTQEELANRCDLSKGFISQLERDLTSPSIATFMDILECLGTTVKDFFDETVNEKVVFTGEDIFESENEELKHTINWLIPNAQKNEMEPILIKMLENGRSNLHNAHEGEIFGYVLEGKIELFLGAANYIIEQGASFYYKANSPHYLQNKAKGESVVLWVSTPPNF